MMYAACPSCVGYLIIKCHFHCLEKVMDLALTCHFFQILLSREPETNRNKQLCASR